MATYIVKVIHDVCDQLQRLPERLGAVTQCFNDSTVRYTTYGSKVGINTAHEFLSRLQHKIQLYGDLRSNCDATLIRQIQTRIYLCQFKTDLIRENMLTVLKKTSYLSDIVPDKMPNLRYSTRTKYTDIDLRR